MGAGTFAWLYRVTNGATDYLDQGTTPLQTVSGFPAGGIAPKAVNTILNFAPPQGVWTAYSVSLPIPATYNYSALQAAGGSQFVRLYLSAALGQARSIFIDKVFLSYNDGLWAAAPDDVISPKQNVSIQPTFSAQGGTGIVSNGTGTYISPSGSGGVRRYYNSTS